MTSRRAPRPASTALRAALEDAAPRTRLAAVQAAWAATVGEQIAAVSRPIAERAGAVTIACADPVWTGELDLMQERLLSLLKERLGSQAPASLRFLTESGDS